VSSQNVLTNPPLAIWRYQRGFGRTGRRDDLLTFRARFGEGLRSGHGLPLTLETEITSGPGLSISMRLFDPESARWFARVAVPLYPDHQWACLPSGADANTDVTRAFTARRAFEWPEPLVPPGGGSWMDSFVHVLRSSPPGLRMRLRARPLPATNLGWWTRPVPEPTRPRPLESDRVGRETYRTSSSPIDPAPRPPFWKVRLELALCAGSPASRLPVDACAAISAVSRTPRGNGLLFRRSRPSRWSLPVARDWLVVTNEEFASFWPGTECDVGANPASFGEPDARLALGRTTDGVVAGPLLEPHQGRHIAVLGETGMGKSSLLIATARRVLREHGGVVFDPLGETARSIRDELGPSERGRLVWIAPEVEEIGLNALEGIGTADDPVRSERRLNDLVHALRRVRAGRYTESGYWGPRLEEMVTRAVRAAAAFPDGTLVDAHTLLATSARLGRPVPGPALESVRELADRIRDRPEDADGARRLLHEVARSPVLVRMLCAASPTHRTRDLVRPGQIVLICGDAARVGESTARYLLSVLLALVWSELLARSEGSKTFVILDEAQWFSHDSLAEMLRLGRRKNVHVLLATQSIGSLPEAVGEAVWTNVSDFVAFRGSPEEAREFARAAPGVPAEAVLSLPRGEAALLLGKGQSVQWVRTARLPGSSHLSELGPPPRQTESRDVDPVDSAPSKGFERVLDELRRAVGTGPEDRPLVVELADLRARADPAGAAVREVGSLLARSGAICRTERSEAGRRWVLDRARLAEVMARPGGGRRPCVPSGTTPVEG
jgi:hypothetical protein